MALKKAPERFYLCLPKGTLDQLKLLQEKMGDPNVELKPTLTAVARFCTIFGIEAMLKKYNKIERCAK